MKHFGQRLLASLTPGVRVLLGGMTIIYLAAIVGNATHTFDLYRWFAMNAPDFWHGQVWRIISYVLLPAGILDFVMNAFALVVIGSMLERHWRRGEFWLFCFISAAGAGFTAALFSVSPPLVGAAPMIFGLLIAWAFISGHETVLFPLFGTTTVQRMVLVLAVLSLVFMVFSAGLNRALILASGGLTGWIYLWLRHKWLMSRSGTTIESGRINRLEL